MMSKVRKKIKETSGSQLDDILDKISEKGIDSLTKSELEFLNQASKQEYPEKFQPKEKGEELSTQAIFDFMYQEMLDVDIEIDDKLRVANEDLNNVKITSYLKNRNLLFLHVEEMNGKIINQLYISNAFFEELKDETGLDEKKVANGFAEWFEEYSGKEVYKIKLFLRKEGS